MISIKSIISIIVAFVCLVLLIAFWPFRTIDPGHMGVVVLLGKAQEEPLKPGFNFVNPMAHVYELNTQIQKAEAKGSAASSDLQVVHTNMTLNYHLAPMAVVKLYTDIGLDYEPKVIDSAIQESFKSVAAQYTAENLIAKREDVRLAIRDLIGKKMKELTNSAVIVDDVFITNFAFSAQFEQAIENKTKLEQDALAEKNRLAKVEYIAKQKVAEAQGESQSMALKRVQATPEFIRLKELEVQQAAIDKWDGQLPGQMLGNAVPFLNVAK